MVQFDRRFVAIAAAKGFISAADFWPVYGRRLLHAGLEGAGETAPQILFEKRWMTYEQIEVVFQEMFGFTADAAPSQTRKPVLHPIAAASRRASDSARAPGKRTAGLTHAVRRGA